MSGGEVFLLVFLVLLILAGVIVTIYFVLRHDDKKNSQTNGNDGNGNGGSGTGGNGTTPLVPGTTPLTPLIPGSTGATGPSGPINTNPIPPTSFSSSQQSGSSTIVWGVTKNEFGSLLTTQTTSLNSPCKNYLFNLENGMLVWQGDGESVIIGQLAPNGGVILVDRSNLPVQQFTSNWVYNDTEKTWCSQENQNLCIQNTPQRIVMNNVSNDPSFKWDKISPLPNTNIPCQT